MQGHRELGSWSSRFLLFERDHNIARYDLQELFLICTTAIALYILELYLISIDLSILPFFYSFKL